MFMFQLGDKLKKSVQEINKLPGREIRQWMAYYSLQNEEYRKDMENKAQHQKLESMTDDERVAQQSSVLGKLDTMFKSKKK